jgi:ABC-type polysaccharide/polyol phosphate transport system ATPase subunit
MIEAIPKIEKIIELDNIGKKYPFTGTAGIDAGNNFKDLWALKGISLEVYKGEVVGAIGRNGAGKTTLLNIMAGVLSQTEGYISVKGRTVCLFNLGIGFQDELSGKENIFLNATILGASRREVEDKLNSMIDFSELGSFIDMPLGSYSQGMRLRLGFSIIANLDFDILVIDEVLAVGDALFQHKCFERLMDFRRLGRTLVITSQSADLIERLCDRAILLDHGNLLFQGNAAETINKYHALLSTEKFFVGPVTINNPRLIENTKKWVDDISEWGKEFGTKEVMIERVDFINKFGFRCNAVKSGDSLKIKVYFNVRNRIKEPHFGIAIFREDGVYCYGPNTGFDGYNISELKPGKSYFTLKYDRLLLAPGNYRVSVAIWDKNETLAFNYHNGYYKLAVVGYDNRNAELLNIPFKTIYSKDKFEKTSDMDIKLFNFSGQEKDRLMTNEPVRFVIAAGGNKDIARGSYLWLGIYRDDGIYCQAVYIPFKNEAISVFFRELCLLPGRYTISAGICNFSKRDFLARFDNIRDFHMVYNKQDHGTVYLRHKWHMEA